MKNFINNFIKRGLLAVFFWFIINLVLAPKVFAVTTGFTNPLGNVTSIDQLILNIARLAMKIGLPIAAIFIIYSGLKFVTARGNEQKLAEARKTFYWAVIGAGILVGAYTISSAIEEIIKALGQA
jgi:hypothetical protein